MSDYERQRLQALRQLKLLDTSPSEGFDRITRTARKLFGLPLSAVSLTDEDRQWFKSRMGTEVTEVPRHKSPCSDVSASSEVVVIEDFLASDFYCDSPQAQLGMRFYAGAPLTTRDGYTLGTLCVLGPEPRTASREEIEGLVDLSAMVMAQIELQHALARVDPVTMLPNHRHFADDLEDLSRNQPGATRYALFIELTGALELNATMRAMGAAQIDALAREGRNELRSWFGEGNTLYSLGPCQYLFLRPASDEQQVREDAHHLQRHLNHSSLWSSAPCIIRPVIGITSFILGDGLGADEVIRTAHSACQDARHQELPVARFTPTQDSEQKRHFHLLTDIRTALQQGGSGLRLVFQPRIALNSGECVGAEALLRWQHPELGEISPVEFIPLLENTPLAKPLTQWVLDAAVAQAAQWFHSGMKLRISANVMASNFEERRFSDGVIERLKQRNLPGQAFEIELTERALMANRRSVRKQLRKLSKAGIRIAIDDFGTGYSSLAYLLNVPANVLKIDRVFSSSTRKDRQESQKALLKALIELAHGMGFRTVAEGFEPSSMAATLRQLGCDEGQSFAISRPLPPDAFSSWYDNPSKRAGDFWKS